MLEIRELSKITEKRNYDHGRSKVIAGIRMNICSNLVFYIKCLDMNKEVWW